MRGFMKGFSVIILSLGLFLSGCGSKADILDTDGVINKFDEYEVEKIRDALSGYTDEIFDIYSSVDAIIYESATGKRTLKETVISNLTKDVKSVTKKIRKMNVPPNMEDIHEVFIANLYLIDEGFDSLEDGFREDDWIKLFMGELYIQAFSYFSNDYKDIIKYMGTYDFNPLMVQLQLERFQKNMEVQIIDNKMEVLREIAQGNIKDNDNPEEIIPVEIPIEEPDIILPDEEEIIDNPIADNYIPYRDYIFPDSSNKVLDDIEIEIEPLYALNLGKNEIYARHGYIFKDFYLQQFFSGKEWYRPDSTFTFDRLNETEQTNVTLIKQEEERRTQDEVFYVNSYRDAWEMLTSVVQNYSTPDLSNQDYLVIYGEPFYVFSMEYFNEDEVMGDMQYAVSAYNGKMYELHSNGDMVFFEYAH